MIVPFVLFLKFLLPVLFIFFPFAGSWLNFALDTADGDILMHFGLDYDTYQTWDKAADYFTYVMMLVVGYRWLIRKEIITTFAIRTVGQALFFLTRKDILFVLFPNFLEPLFMIYALLLFVKKDEKKAYETYRQRLVLIWVIIFVYKMWNELNIHAFRFDLSEAFLGFNN